jgi:adenine-specific DNA methylase
MTAPRLIEVALPIREISAESVRDKSLRHGHISTLHLWFARRPLAASRAVVFASLVPDPDHPDCSPAFREAVERHLKTHVPDVLRSYKRGKTVHLDPDPYRPYDGQPDTLRNRLMMFIAKWSPEWLAFEAGKSEEEPDPDTMLDDRSLVKWETSAPTFHAGVKKGQPVHAANTVGLQILWIARELTRIANGGTRPVVLDPFSGGGAIPLEAGRLGGQPIANDYNPVAYLVLRATCEYPQKYGKPGMRPATYVAKPSSGLFGPDAEVQVDNVLAVDVEYWAKRILHQAKTKLGHLYPAGADKKPVVGYLWSRTAPCSNPSCKIDIPLRTNLWLCKKPEKKVALTMKAVGKEVVFGIATGKQITSTDGTIQNRGSARCPVCGQVTPVDDIRQAGKDGKFGERILAVITDTVGGKGYRLPEDADRVGFQEAAKLAAAYQKPNEPILPEITQGDEDIPNSTGIRVHLYGFTTWGSILNPRQFLAIQTLVDCLHELYPVIRKDHPDQDYAEALACYLGIWIDRIAQRSSTMGVWHTGRETLEHPFGMPIINFSQDYPEANVFSESTGGALGQIDWIQRVIEHESVASTDSIRQVIEREAVPAGVQAPLSQVFLGDGAKLPLADRTVDDVITDPPYFDAISYADLSDYFYVWLKRAVGDVFPDAFATPLTPKAEEATALKHRHNGDAEATKRHFTRKLAECFAEARRVAKPGGVVSIMFAHQTTEAWTALINAIFEAGLTVTATYPIDTELITALKSWRSSLATSITVTCRERVKGGGALFKDVKREVEEVVAASVKRFWGYGFRGADLIVACYGPAVGAFGKYDSVEKQGQAVTVPELLELVRQAAMKAIAGEFTGDHFSRLYYAWANLYGVGEESWDDARLVIQVGGDQEEALELAQDRGLFVLDGQKCRLAVLADRADRTHLGGDKADPLIDQLHRAMMLWKQEDRAGLVEYLHGHELGDHSGFWRLAQALFEVMPRDGADWKLVNALLGERNTLRTEIKRRDAASLGLFAGSEE